MTQKMLCLCAAVALLFAVATANVASAQVVPAPSAPVDCPCDFAPAPCKWACSPAPWFGKGCPPVMTYRIGPFGAIRPVVYAPVYRPVYIPPRFVAPRFVAPYPCATPYAVPARAMYAPYCW